jgi:hypothetical protein
MPKSKNDWHKLSESGKRKIEAIISKGWYRRRSARKQQRLDSAGNPE